MKTKPNTDQFKDINAFLESGNADLSETLVNNTSVQPASSGGRVHREQKVFRLPLDLIEALKREAFERSMQTGARVTETELVETALRRFLNR